VGCACARAPADKPRAVDTRHGRMKDGATLPCITQTATWLPGAALRTMTRTASAERAVSRYGRPPAVCTSRRRASSVRAHVLRGGHLGRCNGDNAMVMAHPARPSLRHAPPLRQRTKARACVSALRGCAGALAEAPSRTWQQRCRAHAHLQQSGMQRQPAAIAHERSTSGRLGGQKRQHKWRRTPRSRPQPPPAASKRLSVVAGGMRSR
jgi:hypothetical protein